LCAAMEPVTPRIMFRETFMFKFSPKPVCYTNR